MKLIDDWRAQLNHLWVVKLALLQAFLGISDQLLALFQMYIPPMTYAILAAVIIVARMWRQKAVE